MKTNLGPSIIPSLRKHLFWDMQGDAPLHEIDPILYQLNKLQKIDPILFWLVRNKLTGKKFLQFFDFEMRHSVFSLINYVLKKVEKEKKERPLLLNKDYIP